MADSKQILSLILKEIQNSKDENKEMYSNIKSHINKFETELLEQKDTLRLTEEKIKKMVYDLEKTFEAEFKRRDEKVNGIEKDMVLVKANTDVNTQNHKDNKTNLNKAVFLVLSGVVGLMFFLFKSNGG